MGLLDRWRTNREQSAPEESRVIGGAPWRPWDNVLWTFNRGGPAHPSRSLYGPDAALGLPALYSATRLIAESVASLPLNTYIRVPGLGQTSRYTGPSIFDQPSSSGTFYDWTFACMTSLLLHGNAWGLITGRDGFGYPTGIEWLPPDQVYAEDDPQQPWNTLRTRVYVFGRAMENWREELFHLKAYALPGRTEGISPVRNFALTILSGRQQAEYASTWFASGGFPPGTFRNSEIQVDKDQADAIREDLTNSIRKRQPLVYGSDWTYTPVSVPPSEAQFVEASRLTATQVAAIFGLPPERVGGTVGDNLHYSSSEQSTLAVIEALRPWMSRLETAFSTLIPPSRYVRFNADALLKTDLETRTKISQMQRDMGLKTVDEIRDSEDLPPLGGQAGNEKMPLTVMAAMARSVKAIPNSILPQVTLEVDLVADRLRQLQAEGVNVPGPEEVLDKSLTGGRSQPDDGSPQFEGAWIEPTAEDLRRLVEGGQK